MIRSSGAFLTDQLTSLAGGSNIGEQKQIPVRAIFAQSKTMKKVADVSADESPFDHRVAVEFPLSQKFDQEFNQSNDFIDVNSVDIN